MDDFQPVKLISGDNSKGLLLLCDHASNGLPEAYGSLGIDASEFERHIAFDIGAEALTIGLAKRLNTPAVMSQFSRLLIDPNRGVDDPTLVRQLSDGTIIPKNYPLSQKELQNRIDRFHKPYHQAIEKALKEIQASGIVPAIFSVHTMTDKWNDQKRPWQMAWLWDNDKRMLQGMMAEMKSMDDIKIGLNEPYDGALGGDTMNIHGTQNGFAHLLLEIRQDLVSNQQEVDEWVDLLSPLLEKINRDPKIHAIEHFGTRTR